MKLSRLVQAFAAVAISAAASASHASLIQVSAANLQGSGFGTVDTLLTLQTANGQTHTESGAVSFNGTQDVYSGDAKTGNSQGQTYTFSSLNISNASDLWIVFNADEPKSGQGVGIDLTDLVLSIYNSQGTAVWTSGSFTPVSYATTPSGIGSAGFVFQLDSTQAAAAQPYVLDGNRIGLSASASGADGGPETFYAYNANTTTPGGGGNGGNVPEPATVALVGLGLAGVALARRKQK